LLPLPAGPHGIGMGSARSGRWRLLMAARRLELESNADELGVGNDTRRHV